MQRAALHCLPSISCFFSLLTCPTANQVEVAVVLAVFFPIALQQSGSAFKQSLENSQHELLVEPSILLVDRNKNNDKFGQIRVR